MNNIYRSIWSESSGSFIAVSENAKGATKNASSPNASNDASPQIHYLFGVDPKAFCLRVLALSLLLIGTQAEAQMRGGVVVSGKATIVQNTGKTTITQATPKLILNWDSFNISKGDSVRFDQPSVNSVALNRVIGSDASSIFGTLTSNGKVFLVNPNGILFGLGASVNVAGLIASTMDMSNSDFNNGNLKFATTSKASTSAASIVNQGNISSNIDGGYVALLGARIVNEGTIAAKLGTVALAAGNQFTLDLAGDGLLKLTIDQPVLQALVDNKGILQADGGQVLLSARTASTILQNVANNTGLIQAQSIDTKNGSIRLLGDLQNGIVNVAGTLDASGAGSGAGSSVGAKQTGGQVEILSKSINLSGATIDVSGNAGGGRVAIGRSLNTANANNNSQITTLSDSTTIHADAIKSGSGGNIMVWSDADATIAGTLTARGGDSDGNGGFIETSGKNLKLSPNTKVNTLATSGKAGMWLLDPVNWTIAGVGGDETPASVIASLAGTDRTISATNDITVNSAVTWVTGQKLQLDAGHDVLINAAMTASTAGSAIVLNAGHDVNVAAAMTASALGSKITMTAVNDIIVSAPLTASALGAKIDLNAQHNLSVGTATADGGGSITFRANNDIGISGAITVDTGSVTIYADNDGTGPGLTGGTVNFTGPSTISAVNTIIRFNPATYASTTSEIATYLTKVVAGTFDAKAWVFAQGVDKVYDATTSSTLTFKGTPSSGGIVNLVAGTSSFGDKNVGTAKTITYSGYTIAGADAGKFALFALFGTVAGSGTTTANITQRNLSVSATGTNRIYNGLTPDSVSLIDNRIGGDVLSTGYANANFVDPNVGIGKIVNVTGISVSGTDAGNYSANSSTTTTANVSTAPLSITASDLTKNYGATAALSNTAFTSAGLVNGETVLNVVNTSPGTAASASAAGSPYTITPSNASGGTFTPSNYAITYINGSLVVLPNNLIVVANDATKNYGQTFPAAATAFTVTGLLNGDTMTSVTETSPGFSANANVIGTPYAITPSAASGSFIAANYTLTYVNGALTVLPVPLIVTANNASKTYGVTLNLPVTAFTTSSLVNGDSVLSVTQNSPGTAAGASVTGSPYVITPSAATGSFTPSNYTLSYVNGALTITPAALLITANNATKNYGQTIAIPTTAFTASGLVNGDTVSNVTETSPGTVASASVIGSPYAITPSAATGSFTPSNYTLTYINGALTVLPIPLQVTANNATKNYGQTLSLPLTAFTTNGLVNGDTVTSVVENSPGTVPTANVIGSPYAITPSAASGSFTPSNYTLSYVNGALTVLPVALTVKASDVSKPYGTEITLTAFTQTGTVNGETISNVNLTSPGTIALASAADSPYVITASNATGSGFTPSNYTITYQPGELTVTAPVTVIPPIIVIPFIPANPDVIPLVITTPETPTGITTLIVPKNPEVLIVPPIEPVTVPAEPIVTKVVPPLPIAKPVATPKAKKIVEPPRKQDRH